MKSALFSFLIFGLSIWCFGQHNNRSVRNLQFRFDNPGARSMGIGGAFTGMADDATAVLANPAGMTQMGAPGLNLELGYQKEDFEIPFFGGNIVQDNLFDFDFQFEPASFSKSDFQVPFFSYVKPFKGFHLGVFYQLQSKIKRSYTTESIYIYPLDQVQDQVRYFPTEDKVDIQLQDFGLALARRFGNSLSLGVSLFMGQMDYLANSTSLAENAIGQPTPAYQIAEGDDTSWGVFGGLYYVPNSWLSLGVCYKKQPEYNYTAKLEQPVVIWQENFEKTAQFKVPDSLSLGMTYRVTDFFLVLFDVQRIYYSQLTDHFVDFNGIEGLKQEMRDTTELHFGLEKILPGLLGGKSVTLRAGYWLEPYHAPLNNVDDNQLLEGSYGDSGGINFRDSFFLHQFQEDVNHYNLGLGLGINQSFHMDFAVDYSNPVFRASLGLVYRFSP